MMLQALCLGAALDVHSPSAGRVHSVFPRAVNIRIQDDLWTLLTVDGPDAPFGIRTASTRLDDLGFVPGEKVFARAGFVSVGSRTRVFVDCRAATRWSVRRPHRLERGLIPRLEVVSAIASVRSWPGSVEMAGLMMHSLDRPGELEGAIKAVLGRGPGLTPAGDDVLVGILAALKSPLCPSGGAFAEQLECAILPLLSRTCDISGYFLRQAARGLFARPIAELIATVSEGATTAELQEAAGRAVNIGASSGADICIGMVASAASFPAWLKERAAA